MRIQNPWAIYVLCKSIKSCNNKLEKQFWKGSLSLYQLCLEDKPAFTVWGQEEAFHVGAALPMATYWVDFAAPLTKSAGTAHSWREDTRVYEPLVSISMGAQPGKLKEVWFGELKLR